MQSRVGFTIWLTGLSGAGKSTLALALAATLREAGRCVEILDGDAVRQHLSQGLTFSKADRDTNILRIAFVAQLLSRNGVVVIVAAISPYREARAQARALVQASGSGFVEVYVQCALDTLIARDVKGLYQRALAGEIAHFTGISDPYEEPAHADIVVDTDRNSEAVCLDRVVTALRDLGYAAAAT